MKDFSRRKKGIDWDAEAKAGRLGGMCDPDLADIIGCHYTAVAAQRRKRGIPAFKPGGGQPFSVAPSAEPPTLRSYRHPVLPTTRPDAPDAKPRSVSEEQWGTLRTWALPEQATVLEALIEHGTISNAAMSLDMDPVRVRALLSEAELRAARAGWSPAHDMTATVPAGFHVKGVSTYYGPDGEVRGQWVKSAADKQAQLEALLDAVQAIAEPLRGKHLPAVCPSDTTADLLSVYPLGDPHVGMLSWGAETGQSFDLEIAEAHLTAVAQELVRISPASEQALIINLGDYFHSDDSTNKTRRSGHPLDVDGRRPKILAVGIRIMRRLIDMALEKHSTVRVINVPGNHDDDTATVISLCMDAYYEREPRVEIDTTADPFKWHRFESNLIGAAHGDACKVNKLPSIMAVDRAEDWGQTKHRFFYTGHVHHDKVIELDGVTVETLRTLAARDGWAHRAGYRSGRDMKCDVVHRRFGRISRFTVGLEQVGFNDNGELNAA